MLSCVSVKTMRLSDSRTIENGVPSKTLMLRAALGIAKSVPPGKGKIIIAAGGGNNGGDGFALACVLAEKGISSTVFSLSEKLSADGAFYKEKAEKAGVPVLCFTPGQNAFSDAGVIVDCLFGTGFTGEVREPYLAAIKEINSSPAFTVCADINSGLNGDTGTGETAVISDVTVSIGLLKPGLVSRNAAKYIKKLVLADIGIPPVKEEYFVVPENEWRSEFSSDEKYIPAPPFLEMP